MITKDGIRIELQYFKMRGKYYSSGSYVTLASYFHELVEEIRGMQRDGTLPGLVEGCREFGILLPATEPWGVPHWFPATERGSE